MARRSSCRGLAIHARIHAMFEFVRERKEKKGGGKRIFREKEAEGREREGFTEEDSPLLNCSD